MHRSNRPSPGCRAGSVPSCTIGRLCQPRGGCGRGASVWAASTFLTMGWVASKTDETNRRQFAQRNARILGFEIKEQVPHRGGKTAHAFGRRGRFVRKEAHHTQASDQRRSPCTGGGARCASFLRPLGGVPQRSMGRRIRRPLAQAKVYIVRSAATLQWVPAGDEQPWACKAPLRREYPAALAWVGSSRARGEPCYFRPGDCP